MSRKKKSEMKVTYVYVEPKTEAEKEDQQQDINAAYDILFEAVLRKEQEEGSTPSKAITEGT